MAKFQSITGSQQLPFSAFLLEGGTGTFELGTGDFTANNDIGYATDATGSGYLVATAHGLVTGQLVHLTAGTAALPTGLSADTDYYIVPGATVDDVGFASSYANAQASTAITMTAVAATESEVNIHVPSLFYYDCTAGGIATANMAYPATTQTVVRIKSMSILVEDEATLAAGDFGNIAALTHGIRIFIIENDWNIVSDLTASHAGGLKSNNDMLEFANRVDTISSDADPTALRFWIDFEQMFGQHIRQKGNRTSAARGGRKLAVWVNDDLSNITAMRFMIHGYREDVANC